MKAILHTSLLAILGLALGSCSSSSNMASTEYDDMYHTPSDRTVAVEESRSASPATYSDGTETQQANNPEYSTESNTGNARTRTSNTDEYYTDNYDYHYSSRIRRFHSPYVGAGYYDPFYTDYYYYNPGAAYYGSIYSGYFYTSPGAWGYDPFWQPRPWGYNPGITVSIGYGWGSPWYSPYYGPYYGGWGSPYYSPYYGYNSYSAGYYHGFYEGATAGGGNRPVYGRRGDRSSTAGNFGAGNGGGRSSGNTGGRGSSNGRVAAPEMNAGRQNVATSGRNASDYKPAGGRNAAPTTTNPGRTSTDRSNNVAAPAPGRTNNNVYQPAPANGGRSVQSPEQPASPRGTRQAVPQQSTGGRSTPATLPGRSTPAPATSPSRSNSGYQPAPAQNPERNVSEPTRSRGESVPQAPAMDRTPDRAPVNATPPAPQQNNRGIRGIFGGSRQNRPEASPSAPPVQRQQPTYSAPAPSRSSGTPSGGGGGSRSGGSSGGGRRGR